MSAIGNRKGQGLEFPSELLGFECLGPKIIKKYALQIDILQSIFLLGIFYSVILGLGVFFSAAYCELSASRDSLLRVFN